MTLDRRFVTGVKDHIFLRLTELEHQCSELLPQTKAQEHAKIDLAATHYEVYLFQELSSECEASRSPILDQGARYDS